MIKPYAYHPYVCAVTSSPGRPSITLQISSSLMLSICCIVANLVLSSRTSTDTTTLALPATPRLRLPGFGDD